jgi:hypothetical protein
MSYPHRIALPLLALMILLGGALSGCAGSAEHESEHTLAMAPLAEMPMDVQQAPVTVQQAYQFAVANPDVLQDIPCYCGCGAMGHASNYACYVAEASPDGVITYDPHALGCSICVDITQDTIRLLKQGKTIPEIRLYVDTTYARFGSSNMPSE